MAPASILDPARIAGFQPTDTAGVLLGETYGGVPIMGMDSVKIAGR